MKNLRITGVVVVALTLAVSGCKKPDDAKATPTPTTPTPTTPTPTTPTPTTPTPTATPTPTPTPTDKDPAPPIPGGALTITYVVEKVGSSFTYEDSRTMDAKLTADGQAVTLSNADTRKKKVEVLEASAGAVTRARITYSEYAKVQKSPKETNVGAVVVGKSYVVELKDGNVVVTADGGGAASAEEIALVTDDNKRFGKTDGMGPALHGMTFKVGEKTAIPGEKLAGVFGDGKVEAMDINMTLIELRDAKALFGIEVKLKGGGPMSVEAAMMGTVLVDPATARMYELRMEGTLSFSGKATGTGTMTGHKAATYQ